MKTLLGMQMACAAVAIVAILAAAAAASPSVHSKQRTTRGFKNAALSTARGFGKRGGFLLPDQDSVADLFTRNHRPKLSTNNLFQESDANDLSELSFKVQNIDSDSMPVEWFADEITNNPEVARLLVAKLLDRNQDGELTVDEVLRPTY